MFDINLHFGGDITWNINIVIKVFIGSPFILVHYERDYIRTLCINYKLMGNVIYRVFLFKGGKQAIENNNVYCKILQLKKMHLKVEIWLRSLDTWFDQSFSNWSEVSIIVGNKKSL